MPLRDLLVACLVATGCATAESARVARPTAQLAPAGGAEGLARSLFEPRGGSGLGEADIARILDAPFVLKLPARVGVVALERGFSPGAPRCADAGLAALRALTEALEGTRIVSLASEVAAELPTGQGIEGLRELAARYRAAYLVLYSERIEDRSHPSGWAALWPTIVGGLVTPSVALEGGGRVEASLLDVRTGTVLFTVQEPVRFSALHLPIGSAEAYRALERRSADGAAKVLAARVVEKLLRVARAADEQGAGAAASRDGKPSA